MIVCFLFLNTYSQKNEAKLTEVKNSITQIEKRFDDQMKILKQEQDNNFKEFKNERDVKFNNLSMELNIYRIMSTIFTLLGGGLILYLLSGGALKIVTKLFKKTLHDEEENLIKIILSRNEDNKLKNKKKILVLTPKNGDDSFVRKILQNEKFNIENITHKSLNENFEICDFKSTKIDLVLFNDKQKPVGDVKIVENIFKTFPKNVLKFYFGDKRIEMPEELIGFANPPFQLYGNLMNALRYQDKLVD